MKECDSFEEGSRNWLICRGEAGIAKHKVNFYRKIWGMIPLFASENRREAVVNDGPHEVVFHGQSAQSEEVEQEPQKRKGCGCGRRKK
jgi:hypothetical protein